MGLFSSKKETYVSSVVYNMAGDVQDRANYLKTLAVSRVLEGTEQTFTRDSLQSYLRGPGITLRRFGRWASLYGYNANVGVVQSTISVANAIDLDALKVELENVFDNTIYLNEAQIGSTNYGMWATQWVLANYPEKYLLDWTADFDEDSNEIIIKFPNMFPIRFTPDGFVKYSQYLYISLNQEKPAESSAYYSDWFQGAVPSTAGYTQVINETVPTDVEVVATTNVVQTVDDEDPYTKVFEEPATVTIDLTNTLYTKRENLPESASTLVLGAVTYSIETREVYYIEDRITTETLVEEVEAGTRTTVITRTEPIVQKRTEYRTSTVTLREKAWQNEQIYIYRRNSGNPVLDAFFVGTASAGAFFPIIPVRHENQFISDSYYPAVLPWVKKAVRRATNFSFEKLVELVADNESLSDIDFAYVIFGASLNTPENAAKRYIYEFFRTLGMSGGTDMTLFWEQYDEAVASWDAWVLWYSTGRHLYADSNESGWWIEAKPEPERLPIPDLPKQTINISSSMNYNISLSFAGVSETVHPGVYAAGAVINDLRVYKGGERALYTYPEQSSVSDRQSIFQWNRLNTDNVQETIIEWQDTATSYRRLVITGLVHVNNVYGGKSITTTGWQALADGEESGFIVPMQDDILQSLPIPVATQLCTATTYMLFNCYQVVKKKWYQTGIFQIVIVIIAIVITVVSGGTGASASAGLLGTNAAVGAAIGFTGTAAIVAGAVANAIVAMVVSQIISKVSRAVLGDKIGSIIGAVASFVAISVGTSMATGQPISASFGNMLKAENLFKLTSAIGDGISNYMAASTAEIQAQTAEVLADYQTQAKELSEKFMQEFGGTGIIDPLRVADVNAFRLEDPAKFFDRTLMTGTDIAEISQDMLDNFVNLTLTQILE